MLFEDRSRDDHVTSVLAVRRTSVNTLTARTPPQPLRRHPQRPVELAGGVFPGDGGGQLDDRIVVVVGAEAGEESVVDVAVAEGDGVGVGEGGALGLVVERARRVVGEGIDFLVRNTQLAADGSVEVLSELAPVVRRDATIDDRDEFRVEQTGGVETAPHAAGAAEDRGTPGVNQVIEERSAPFPRLRPQHGRDRLVDVVGIDPFDARHMALPIGGVRDDVRFDLRMRQGGAATVADRLPTIWPLSGSGGDRRMDRVWRRHIAAGRAGGVPMEASDTCPSCGNSVAEQAINRVQARATTRARRQHSERTVRTVLAVNRAVYRFARHWLLFVNGFLFVYVVQLFLAPALVAAGHQDWARPIYGFNGLFCHQRPDRSFFVFGHKMACCERCAAIYGSMFLLGLLFVVLRSRIRFPSWRAAGLLATPVAIDGLAQLVGLHESNAALRVITGAVFAIGVCWLLFPYLEVGFAQMRAQIERRFARLVAEGRARPL